MQPWLALILRTQIKVQEIQACRLAPACTNFSANCFGDGSPVAVLGQAGKSHKAQLRVAGDRAGFRMSLVITPAKSTLVCYSSPTAVAICGQTELPYVSFCLGSFSFPSPPWPRVLSRKQECWRSRMDFKHDSPAALQEEQFRGTWKVQEGRTSQTLGGDCSLWLSFLYT